MNSSLILGKIKLKSQNLKVSLTFEKFCLRSLKSVLIHRKPLQIGHLYSIELKSNSLLQFIQIKLSGIEIMW